MVGIKGRPARSTSRLKNELRIIRVRFKRRVRPVFRFLNAESVALSLGVWTIIEILLVLWNHDLKDYLSVFVDPKLLIAQFIASVVFFSIAMVVAVKEGRNSTGSSISARNYRNLQLLKEEAVKVPIFFGSAMFVSSIFQALDSINAMDRRHNFEHWVVNLQPATYWLMFSVMLYVFAGIVNRSLN